MFFVRQPEYYTTFERRSLNPVCPHLHFARRQELAVQRQRQQREEQLARYIQYLNKPEISTKESENAYHLILSKKINRENYQYVRPFQGYELELDDDEHLVIRSKVDGYEEYFQLPQNADKNADVEYKVVKNGYVMIISVKKEERVRRRAVLFGDLVMGLANGCEKEAAAEEEEEEETAVEEAAVTSKADNTPDMLKNYSTTTRRTVFTPNITQETPVAPTPVPVQRMHTPTVEDVIDEEFM